MIKNFFNIKNIFILTLCAGFAFSACKKEEPEIIIDNTPILQVSDLSEFHGQNPFKTGLPKWRKTNKRICVVFGYDYNDPENVAYFTNLLEENFGLENEDGLIYTITYPNDFKNTKTYISELTAMLTENDKDLIGVVILGAPERTHYALGRVQDYWNMEIPYPIFCLFPQDEALGLESTCDFVLDKHLTADISGEISEEDAGQIVEKTPEVLIPVINYMQNLNGALKKDASVQGHVVQMLKGKKLQYYTDPETGLHAINHFVIY